MTQVKICGNTNFEDVRLAADLGADYLGFIFTASKRKVEPEAVARIIAKMRDFRNFVGVFANQPKAEVEGIACHCGIRILQFHGDETARYCQFFMDKGFTVIKTFRIKDKMSLKRIDEYNVSAYLFDTYSKAEQGGSGIPFDWDLIENRPFVREKLFLAGGLNIHNLEAAIRKVHPMAVDVASGVEKEPGKKDPDLLRRFIEIAKRKKVQDARTR